VPRPILDPIAQLDDDPQSWPRFLYKASTGSSKAAEWVCYADLALAERLGGRRLIDEASLADYNQSLRQALPSTPPFSDTQALLDLARAASVVAGSLTARSRAFHDRAHYDQLWRRGTEVHPAQLLHDAARVAAQHWNGATFRQLVELVKASDPDYNSQDAVAAMLYLSAAHAQLPDSQDG
jgi:hypothetical protein